MGFADSFDEVRQLQLDKGAKRSAICGFLDADAVLTELRRRNVFAADLRREPITREDTVIALTGKY